MRAMSRAILATLVALVLILVACDAEAEVSGPGTFEEMLGWVPREMGHTLHLGDMVAWREVEHSQAVGAGALQGHGWARRGSSSV